MTHEGILRIIYPNKQTPSLLDKMTQLWYRRKPSSFLTTIPVFAHLHVLFRVSFSSAFYKIAWMKIHQNLVNKLHFFFCPQMQLLCWDIFYIVKDVYVWLYIIDVESHTNLQIVFTTQYKVTIIDFSLFLVLKYFIRVCPVFLSTFVHSPVRCGV